MNYTFQAPPLTKTNKILLITMVSIFLLHSVLGLMGAGGLTSFLSLSLHGVGRGLIFQLVTYPFVQSDLMGLLFNGLVLWFFGGDLEARWGTKKYLTFLLIVAVSAGLFYLLVTGLFLSSMGSYPLSGLHGVAGAMLVVYAFLFPDREMAFMMLFPMKSKHFCLLMAGIELYMAIFSAGGKSSWAHLMAMAVGFLFISGNPWKKSKSVSRSPARKSNLFVIKGEKDQDDGPKYWQ